MSGPAVAGNGSPTPALTFQVSGEERPRKTIMTTGTVAYSRPGALHNEPPTVLERHLSNSTQWDPEVLLAGEAATLVLELRGAVQGDVVVAAHSGIAMRAHRVQLTAASGDDEVEAILVNVGRSPVDVPAGKLRVVAMQLTD
jgi:hypothetical protein